MGGTGARGRTYLQPLTLPLGTPSPTTPKPDKSHFAFVREYIGEVAHIHS
jgi:hypothetical protein